jgi:hypothetical protein
MRRPEALRPARPPPRRPRAGAASSHSMPCTPRRYFGKYKKARDEEREAKAAASATGLEAATGALSITNGGTGAKQPAETMDGEHAVMD